MEMDEAERRRQPTHKRYQTRVACEQCHRQKLRCDTKRPCRRCIDSGRKQFCCDRPHRKTGRPRKLKAAKPSSSIPVASVAAKPTSSSSPLKHREEMGSRVITSDVAHAEMRVASSKVAKKRCKREESASRASSSKTKMKSKFDGDNTAATMIIDIARRRGVMDFAEKKAENESSCPSINIIASSCKSKKTKQI